MNDTSITRLPACVVWTLLVVASSCLCAQVPVAPKPSQLIAAKTVFLSNDVLAPLGDSDKLLNNIYNSIQQLNRFTIVSSPADADLILEYSMAAFPDNRQIICLRVIDPKTRTILWSTSDAGQIKDLYSTSGKKPKSDALGEIADYLKVITTPQPTAKP
jgi:hypothetical protein